MKKLLIVHFVICYLLLGAVLGQVTRPKMAISISHTGDDSIGTQVAYQVKELVASSSLYNLSDASVLKISIVSCKIREGYTSALSVAYILFPVTIDYLATHSVYVVSSDNVTEIARDIMADADKAFSDSYDFAASIFKKNFNTDSKKK